MKVRKVMHTKFPDTVMVLGVISNELDNMCPLSICGEAEDFGFLCHINHCRLFNSKYCLYICIKYI